MVDMLVLSDRSVQFNNASRPLINNNICQVGCYQISLTYFVW